MEDIICKISLVVRCSWIDERKMYLPTATLLTCHFRSAAHTPSSLARPTASGPEYLGMRFLPRTTACPSPVLRDACLSFSPPGLEKLRSCCRTEGKFLWARGFEHIPQNLKGQPWRGRIQKWQKACDLVM